MLRYISVDILGGLGNQLFQIALGLFFLKKCQNKDQSKLVFYDKEQLPNKYNLPRKTFWNTLFKDQFTIIQRDNNTSFNMYYESISHVFLPLPYAFPANIMFNGYFQSFAYIDYDLRDMMKTYLYSNQSLVDEAKAEYEKIKEHFNDENNTSCVGDDDMVSVHIRRTDYVFDSDFHHNLYFDYYKNALNTVSKKYIVVFSDDIDWCMQNIAKNVYSYDKIYFVNTNSVEIDFLLMSMFKHNVIANSTFSLWASFISTCLYDDKIIVAPKTWYASSGPKEWKEIYHKYITHVI